MTPSTLSDPISRIRLVAVLSTLAVLVALLPVFPHPARAQSPGDLVINEIMQNPDAVFDSAGEWFELANTTGSDIDIDGWTISDNGTDSHLINNGGPLFVPANGFLVLGNNPDTSTNGGVAVDYAYSSFTLANGGDELVLTDTAATTEIDRVEWDGGPVFPDPTGAAMALNGPANDNNDGTNWCTAATPYGDGDLGTPGAANDCSEPPEVPDVRFSEIHYDNSGSDVNEAIEVLGPAGTDLTDWTVVLYNGSTGVSYATETLSGTLTDQGGGVGTLHVDGFSSIQNGAPDGFALADNSGTVVEFLSYEGTFTGSGDVADGVTSTDIGVAEGSSTLPTQSLQRLDDGTWQGPLCASFGEINDPGAPTECPTAPMEKLIHEVQGASSTSPLVGTEVIIEGIVTSDFQGTEFLRGFNLQEEDADHDADDNTSEGVFIFDFANGANGDVSIGDTVRVTGTVSEFNGETQVSGAVIEILNDVTDDVIDPGVLTTFSLIFPVDPTFDFETIEGMWVTVAQDMYVSEYFNFDRFNEVVIGAERYQQPTAQYEPGSAEWAAAGDLIARGQIILDDARTTSNPEVSRHPNGDPFTLDNRFRGGDVLNDVTGVISPNFGWRIQPTGPANHLVVNPRPADHDNVGGTLEVASFNVLNYFTTIDTGAAICGPDADQGCRGADNAEELERQAAKIVAALVQMDSDVVGLIEIENHGDDAALADLVSRLNAVVGPGSYDYVRHDNAGVKAVGGDAIRVAIIYKPSSVTPVGSDAVLDDPSFLDPLNEGNDKNRAAQAQMFEQNATGERFSVVINHLKSKGSACLNDPNVNGQGNCNLTRQAAAIALAEWIDTDPYFNSDSDVLVMGDLNAYDKEDPIDALIAAGYTDLVADYLGEDAYSFVFSAQTGYLDYAMANTSIASQVTGATIWQINADEPDLLDYDTSFKSDGQDAIYAPDAYRSSDHDPVIVGLALDQTPPEVEAGFDRLFSTRHFGIFKVDFSCADIVDPSPDCVGDINGVEVSDGQLLILIKGPGQPWHRVRHGVLWMKAPSFELSVVGTDDAGNSATATAEPEFRRPGRWR